MHHTVNMAMDPANPINDITRQVISAAITVHRELGPGLLESAYQACLEFELVKQNVEFKRQQIVPLVYQGNYIECGYRVDLIVSGKVIVEVKSVETIAKIHIAQVITYLKLMRLESGLLLNFNVTSLRNGIRRLDRRDGHMDIRNVLDDSEFGGLII
jgi:GxxExxY protein